MARDKAKDDKHFNCSEEHEFNYVSGLYPNNKQQVYNFLKLKCSQKVINYSTHKEVYQLIHQELGLPMPH